MTKLLLLIIALSSLAHGQAWSTFIDSSRAINWNTAGAGFTLPSYITPCSTQPSLTAGSGNAAANTTAINNALASCDSTHNVVNVPAGTYYINGVNFANQGLEVLRGAGPNCNGCGSGGTDLILTASANEGCGGIPTGICMSNSSYATWGASTNPPSGTRQCAWTAGYAQGTTSITLNTCPGSLPSVGQFIILDQANDLTDNGGVWLCDSYTSTQTVASISSFTGTSGTLTFTTGSQTLIAGDVQYLTGFSSPNTGLNGQAVVVLSAGLSSTSFEAAVTGSGYSSGAGSIGGSACSGNDLTPANGSGRQNNSVPPTYSQHQLTAIQSISGSGSGPYTVTINPPVYFTNIRSGQTPGAWWLGAQVVNDGIENMTIDATSLNDSTVAVVLSKWRDAIIVGNKTSARLIPRERTRC